MSRFFAKKLIIVLGITVIACLMLLPSCNDYNIKSTKSFNTNNITDASSSSYESVNSDLTSSKNVTRQYLTLDTLRSMVGDSGKYTGQGITVAVIDSGTFQHDDLIKPQNRIMAFKDFVNNANSVYDDNGHGTAICGIIAGNGYMSGGAYQGIAPNCNLVVAKALDKDGNCNINVLLKALDWVANNIKKYNIRILNISIGIKNSSENYNLLKVAIDNIVNSNVLIITSVGNKNTNDTEEIYLPAALPEVLSVGSINDISVKNIDQYQAAPFSSNWKDANGVQKPDLLAPGNSILATQSNVLYNPLDSNSTNMNVSYVSSTGTSNSAAVVSGLAAILMQQYPSYNNFSIQSMLLKKCTKINASMPAQGAGFIYLNQ